MKAIPEKSSQLKKKKRLDPINEENVRQCQQEPIWKVIADLGEQIPLTTWEKVPDDASINFKHYLYGDSNLFLYCARIE